MTTSLDLMYGFTLNQVQQQAYLFGVCPSTSHPLIFKFLTSLQEGRIKDSEVLLDLIEMYLNMNVEQLQKLLKWLPYANAALYQNLFELSYPYAKNTEEVLNFLKSKKFIFNENDGVNVLKTLFCLDLNENSDLYLKNVLMWMHEQSDMCIREDQTDLWENLKKYQSSFEFNKSIDEKKRLKKVTSNEIQIKELNGLTRL